MVWQLWQEDLLLEQPKLALIQCILLLSFCLGGPKTIDPAEHPGWRLWWQAQWSLSSLCSPLSKSPPRHWGTATSDSGCFFWCKLPPFSGNMGTNHQGGHGCCKPSTSEESRTSLSVLKYLWRYNTLAFCLMSFFPQITASEEHSFCRSQTCLWPDQLLWGMAENKLWIE